MPIRQLEEVGLAGRDELLRQLDPLAVLADRDLRPHLQILDVRDRERVGGGVGVVLAIEVHAVEDAAHARLGLI